MKAVGASEALGVPAARVCSTVQGSGRRLDDHLDLLEEETAQPVVYWDYLEMDDIGRYALRAWAAVRAGGENGIRLLSGRFDGPPPPRLAPVRAYDCAATLATEERNEAWASWNILAYLEDLRRTRGIDVVVAHWPVNHQPSGACYNLRTSTARLTQFLDWLRAESAARGLEYVDLHDLLRPDEFLDSLHLTAEGNRHVAAALAPVVESVLRRRASDSRRDADDAPGVSRRRASGLSQSESR